MRRTGVIVGIENPATAEQAAGTLKLLCERFPGVTFAVVSGANSVVFEYVTPTAECTCYSVAGDDPRCEVH